MSWPAVAWALGQKAPSSGAKFLLVVLADNAGAEHWRSFPSVAYLVDTTQQDRKTVLKNLRALEEAALIVPDGKTGRTGQVKVWRLPVVLPDWSPKNPKKGTVSQTETGPDFPAKSPNFPGKESQKRDTEPVIEPCREPEKSNSASHVASAVNDSTPKRGRRKAPELTLCQWLEALRETGEKALPRSHAVFGYAERIGLPIEFLHLAWVEFKAKHLAPPATGKRPTTYADWRAVFLNAVKGNWLKLWYLDGQQYALTTAGQQAQRHLQAEQQREGASS